MSSASTATAVSASSGTGTTCWRWRSLPARSDVGGPAGPGGRLPEHYLAPGISSFTDFLSDRGAGPAAGPPAAAAGPGGRTSRRTAPRSSRSTYAGGVLMAGDRRATMGNLIAQRDIEKVFPADAYSVVGIAGTAGIGDRDGPALPGGARALREDRGHPRSPSTARPTGWPAMIRGNLGAAMQGLAVRAAVRRLRPRRRRPGRARPDLQLRRRPAGRTRSAATPAIGSGSLFARGLAEEDSGGRA